MLYTTTIGHGGHDRVPMRRRDFEQVARQQDEIGTLRPVSAGQVQPHLTSTPPPMMRSRGLPMRPCVIALP